MRNIKTWRQEEPVRHKVSIPKGFEQIADEIYEKALNDARAQLHPLLRIVEAGRLSQRHEFVQAFRTALEQRIARKLAAWQPGVQAIFKFDESWMRNRKSWDGSIHLLVQMPHLSHALQMLTKKLDQNLVKCLKQLGWSPFRKRQSVLEVQQVTTDELRRGIGYGAMFCAVYSRPVQVWSQSGWGHEGPLK
jgi:hypothetical protein